MLQTNAHKTWQLRGNEPICWKIKCTTTHPVWNRSVENLIIIKEI